MLIKYKQFMYHNFILPIDIAVIIFTITIITTTTATTTTIIVIIVIIVIITVYSTFSLPLLFPGVFGRCDVSSNK